MQYCTLGNTGLTVSKMCFGALTIGPLQADLKIDEGSELILEAIENGVNFIDTAELYETYPYIKNALKKTNKDICIASRSYAYTKEMAKQSLELARKELDRDVIEIFGLHQQESEHTMRGHREALEYFIDAKQRGLIKAVLITTHHVEVVKLCSKMPEIDVIHAILNKNGLGIADGSVQDMVLAIKDAYDCGKGIYSMKPLGGGNLIKEYAECMDFVMGIEQVHSIAIGVKNSNELKMNIDYFNGKKESAQNINQNIKEKKLHIDYWCERCGKCVKVCSQNALSIIDNKVCVDKSKCLLCGYCGSVCPQFAIKVI